MAKNPGLAQLSGARSTRAVLSNKRGISTSITESLGGITIGILVMAAAGVGVAAAYNIGQDSTAKSALDAISPAQTIVQNRTGSFGDLAALTTGVDPAMTGTPAFLAINATATNYCAVIKSKSMFPKTYWITAKSGKVLDAAPTETGNTCPAVPTS